jgi:site-specific recombinase XerD
MEQKKIKMVDLCNLVEQELINLGFGKTTFYGYRSVWKKLQIFAGDAYYSPKLCADFLAEEYQIKSMEGGRKFTKKQMYYLRTVRLLADYFNFGTFFRRRNIRKDIEWPDNFSIPVKSYISDLTVKGRSSNHLYRTQNTIKAFLLYLDKISVYSITDVTSEQVVGYITTLVGYAPKTIGTMVSILRCFFRYLYINEIITFPLSESLPKVPSCVRTILPTVWSKGEIEKIIKVIDRGNPVGKRNYAIILLVARLGLRIGDVRDLQLSNIDWNTNEIKLLQNKTNSTLTLPLLNEVGWAIIDYLKYGRPETEAKNVFVNHIAPFRSIGQSNNLYNMIMKYIVMAGIPVIGKSRIGMHSLRHSLASELMQNNVEITTISEILGHSTVETTRQYLRVNLSGLQQCALDVEVVKHEI